MSEPLDLRALGTPIADRTLLKSHGLRVLKGCCKCCEEPDETWEIWCDSCDEATGIQSEELANLLAAAPALLALLRETLIGLKKFGACQCRHYDECDCGLEDIFSKVTGW